MRMVGVEAIDILLAAFDLIPPDKAGARLLVTAMTSKQVGHLLVSLLRRDGERRFSILIFGIDQFRFRLDEPTDDGSVAIPDGGVELSHIGSRRSGSGCRLMVAACK